MESKPERDEQVEALLDRPAVNEVPRGAVRVQPYKPNRKQRRAQEKMLRKKK